MKLISPPPLPASGALQFASDKATMESKITIGALVMLALFSWSVIVRGEAPTPFARVRMVLAADLQANVLKVDLATAAGAP